MSKNSLKRKTAVSFTWEFAQVKVTCSRLGTFSSPSFPYKGQV